MRDEQTKRGTPTLDGERVRVSELNTGLPFSGSDKSSDSADRTPANPLLRAVHNFNQFLAGMYTGVTCHGTPHSHHSDHDQDSIEKADKPDNRPL